MASGTSPTSGPRPVGNSEGDPPEGDERPDGAASDDPDDDEAGSGAGRTGRSGHRRSGPADELADRLQELGEFIRGQREVASMSVRRLADLAGVSNPYLSQIERGLRRPSAEILQQLANALKISVETLYVHAGFLTPDPGPAESRTRDAITSDERLSPEQKQALLNVYDNFVGVER
jgi:transcriptional regulator with XRE-family HTH domain